MMERYFKLTHQKPLDTWIEDVSDKLYWNLAVDLSQAQTDFMVDMLAKAYELGVTHEGSYLRHEYGIPN